MATKSFEKALQELEEIVSELEDGDLHLEKAFKKFAEGVKLSKFCSHKLDETERKTSLLLQDEEGRLVEKPFEEKTD